MKMKLTILFVVSGVLVGVRAEAQLILHELHAFTGFDAYGTSVDGIGDVDGDDFDDFLIGVPNFPPNQGNVFAYSGATGAVIHQMTYPNGPSGQFGRSISGAGDMDGDAVSDFIAGAPFNNTNGSDSGSVWVYSGTTSLPIHMLYGGVAGDFFGWSVSGAGDVNGDAYADFIVGAWGAGADKGEATVFSGLDASVLYTFVGDAVGDGFGTSVSDAGDVNGDSVPDFIVGAPYSDANGVDSGLARVFSGATGAVLYTFVGDSAGDLFGGNIPGSPSRGVSDAGDVNGDGFADVIVGAFRDDNTAMNSGSARVFSGVDGSILHTFNGDNAGDSLGYAVSGVGDINADGFDDLLVGAPGNDNVALNSGLARILSGIDGQILATLVGVASNDQFGKALSDGGDINGDSFADLVIASPDRGGGFVYVYNGYELVPCVDGDMDGYGDPSSPQCTF
ncbi:MAG: FG-GAP repeat protein, partial [Myxococcales bacterium]|nr:FG-GAP repeat protein [Myxococcales bacterium]